MTKKGKKRKQDIEKGNNRYIKLMIIAAFVLFLIIVARMTIEYMSGIVKKDMAYPGKMSDTINISCLVLYDFDSYDIPDGTTFVKTAKQSDRIRVNGTAGVFAETSNPLYNELVETNERIQHILKIDQVNTGIPSKDEQIINDNILNGLLALPDVLEKSPLSGVVGYKETIDFYCEYKAGKYDELLSKSGSYDNEKRKFDNLKQTMSEDAVDILCINPGYVTYDMFHNQQLYTYDNMKMMYPADIKELLYEDIPYTSNTAVKIATSEVFHIAAVMSSSDAARIKDLKNMKINVNTSGMDFSIDIKRVIIGNGQGNETIVFFETDHALSKLVSLQKFDGLLVVKQYEGLKIPVSAMKNYKYALQKPQVALIKGITIRLVNIDILYTDGVYAIVRSVDSTYKFNAYDYYALYPDKVKDGDIVH